MLKQCIIIYEIERLFMDNIPHEEWTILLQIQKLINIELPVTKQFIIEFITADDNYTAEINLTTGSTADYWLSAYLQNLSVNPPLLN